jgi:hypothetical protein
VALVDDGSDLLLGQIDAGSVQVPGKIICQGFGVAVATAAAIENEAFRGDSPPWKFRAAARRGNSPFRSE